MNVARDDEAGIRVPADRDDASVPKPMMVRAQPHTVRGIPSEPL